MAVIFVIVQWLNLHIQVAMQSMPFSINVTSLIPANGEVDLMQLYVIKSEGHLEKVEDTKGVIRKQIYKEEQTSCYSCKKSDGKP